MTAVRPLARLSWLACLAALISPVARAGADDTALVSVNALGTASANAPSTAAAISADGNVVAFASTASDIVTNDGNGLNDVFARDLAAGTTALVSVDTTGSASGDNDSFGPPNGPVLSASGRFVAFQSYAGNLVSLPTFGTTNVFIRDLQADMTTLASINMARTGGGNSGSSFPMLSADGDRVVFQSNASDLVSFATNGTTNAFVHDVDPSDTSLLSLNRSGAASGDAAAFSPVISADGSVAAFVSFASDLAELPTIGRNVFARDLTAAHTVLVSVNRAGTGPGDGDSSGPVLSADGRYVAFVSSADDLVDNDTNGAQDVFVRDLLAGTTTLVSVNRDGTASGNQASSDPVISADGRRIAFVSVAGDLVNGDDNGTRDVFVRDLVSSTTMLVSINPNGASGNDASDSPTMSADGNVVAFVSFASDLAANDTNQVADVLVRHLQTGVTNLITMNSAGTASADDASGNPFLSADGRHVAFESFARDLVAPFADGNGAFNMDVFSATVPFPSCTGDCDADGRVSVDELVLGVNIALGNDAVTACEAFDADHNHLVTVDELVSAVNNALDGCPD